MGIAVCQGDGEGHDDVDGWDARERCCWVGTEGIVVVYDGSWSCWLWELEGFEYQRCSRLGLPYLTVNQLASSPGGARRSRKTLKDVRARARDPDFSGHHLHRELHPRPSPRRRTSSVRATANRHRRHPHARPSSPDAIHRQPNLTPGTAFSHLLHLHHPSTANPANKNQPPTCPTPPTPPKPAWTSATPPSPVGRPPSFPPPSLLLPPHVPLALTSPAPRNTDRGSTSYGSGTTGGPGHGNKTAPDPEELDHDGTRLDSAHKTSSYTGGTKYGSGTTAGPG